MNLTGTFRKVRIQRSLAFGVIIVAALLAFEAFNYSTTDFALRDLLGDLKFAGFRWATILSIAFCGIDFAGIARLFTPEQGSHGRTEAWYLFAAWMLAATMNAVLTWWGVSIAIATHRTQASVVIDPATITKVVPVFVALMVWLIRILIIGTLSYAGSQFFSQSERRISSGAYRPAATPALRSAPVQVTKLQPRTTPARPSQVRTEPLFTRPEPTYHSMGGVEAKSSNGNRSSGMS